MFTLQIHTVDSPQPLVVAATAPFTTSGAASSRSKSKSTQDQNPTNHPTELRGIVHFFRRLLPPPPPAGFPPLNTTVSNPSLRTTLLFIVAVPNYISPDDFFSFCGNQLDHSSQVCFLRDDGMEDRYCIIMRLVDQMSADGLFYYINGKRFNPSENEVCHVYFAQSVAYMESAEIAAMPPPGFTELPSCPVCLERLDQDTSAIKRTHCDHSFGFSCVSKWTYLSCQVCRLCQRQDEKRTCEECGTSKSPWVCLICGFVGCGRYVEGHAQKHWRDTKYSYFLGFETQQIWDCVGDKYVHRLNQSKAYGKSVVTDFSCMSLDGECGTCNDNEDSGMSGALFSSKVETIVEEYNHLLATQMETQRHHYEMLLAEARSRKEHCSAKAVEKAVAAMILEVQHKLDKPAKDSKIVADVCYMDSSSSSRTRDTRNSQFNGEIIKFRNEKCKCNRRAIVRISESMNNHDKLYYKCESEKCDFYKFWEPNNGDINWSAFVGNIAEDIGQQQTLMEVRAIGGGVQSGMQTLHLGMQGLNYVVGGMKMLLMLCFCVCIVNFFVVFFLAMK